jgi:hypothetical protein
MTDLREATCKVEGCGGPRAGICINNLSFEECPDVITELVGDGGDAAEVLEAKPDPTRSFVETSLGDSLDAEACDRLLRATGGTMIGIIAGPEAGKTTLVASIYERIQRAKSSVFGFASSETIRGYEERCHLARFASGGTESETERTKTWAELSFTHLEVVKEDCRKHLIFSDRSGEHFDNVLDTPNDIIKFRELDRANHIWLVVDLERLSQGGHGLKSGLRKLVMALQEAQLLDGKQICVVGTKADLFTGDAEFAIMAEQLDEFIADLKNRVPAGITFERHMVGCRSSKGSSEFGSGIDDLLATLIKTEEEERCAMTYRLPVARSEIDRLMQRIRCEP